MPQMSFSHKMKLFSNYIYDGRWREIYNILFWVYPYWWNKKTAYFLMNKLYPKLGIDLFPPFLEIEPTTVCGYRCKICEHTYWDELSRHMKFEEFKHLFDQFGSNPKWLGLTGIGSSYLNPDFHKMLDYAKSKGTIVEVMDHFGNIKDEEKIRELLEIGPDFQFISIYGGTKETSDKVCVGSDYNVIIRNIRSFVRLKKEMKKRFPILSFHYIVSADSKDELFGFMDFVHSLDTEIGEILVTPLLHDFEETAENSVKMESEYIDRVRALAKEYGISITINMLANKEDRKKEQRPPIKMCKEYIMPFIFHTGHINPCCALNEANERELQKEQALGNLFHENLKDLWYSPRYKNMRKMIRENTCPQECTLCPAYISDNMPALVQQLNSRPDRQHKQAIQIRA